MHSLCPQLPRLICILTFTNQFLASFFVFEVSFYLFIFEPTQQKAKTNPSSLQPPSDMRFFLLILHIS